MDLGSNGYYLSFPSLWDPQSCPYLLSITAFTAFHPDYCRKHTFTILHILGSHLILMTPCDLKIIDPLFLDKEPDVPKVTQLVSG